MMPSSLYLLFLGISFTLARIVPPHIHISKEVDQFPISPSITYPLPSRCKEIVPIETKYFYDSSTKFVNKQKTIHTIGDGSSLLGLHSLFTHKKSFDMKGISSIQWINHWMGPLLIQSIIDDSSMLNFKNIIKPENNSIIALSFGEIDARINIPLLASKHQKGDIHDLAKNLVFSYEKIIQSNIESLNDLTISLWIMSVPPPMLGRQPMSPLLRKESVIEINKALIEMCKRNSWYYFDRYTSYSDDSGFLLNYLSDSRMHIMQYSDNSADLVATEMTRKELEAAANESKRLKDLAAISAKKAIELKRQMHRNDHARAPRSPHRKDYAHAPILPHGKEYARAPRIPFNRK